jgi:uroporphyrinogen III methyltransferase/synthase
MALATAGRNTMMHGKVYLVGAGPGDPGLITVRGLEVIRQADVVIYDRLVHPDLVRQAPAHAVRIYVGKEAGLHCVPQSQINDLLMVYAQHGALVVRLKGGDPFVFGRGGEEAEALATAGIAFEIVPGVSSVVAVPAYAGIPLTHRTLSSSFAVVTGHEENGKRTSAVDWETLATAVDTLVVLMGVKSLRQIVTQLLLHGRSPETLVALIRWGTTAHQQTITGTLANIADKAEEAALESPVVTVVGEVVRLRDHLQWFAELQEGTERAPGRSGDRENKHQGPNPPISHSPDLPF